MESSWRAERKASGLKPLPQKQPSHGPSQHAKAITTPAATSLRTSCHPVPATG
ncbi:hypothetical protein [Lysobacter gummosus]|uniref:hypothetical protein n=1 Tax=Lysobacter gummosus TaxID=262324 RepID=UPI003627C375